MTDTHEKFMEQARQVTKTILRMDPCYPEQFEMRDIIAAALVAAHQDGIREGKRQAVATAQAEVARLDRLKTEAEIISSAILATIPDEAE